MQKVNCPRTLWAVLFIPFEWFDHQYWENSRSINTKLQITAIYNVRCVRQTEMHRWRQNANYNSFVCNQIRFRLDNDLLPLMASPWPSRHCFLRIAERIFCPLFLCYRLAFGEFEKYAEKIREKFNDNFMFADGQ